MRFLILVFILHFIADDSTSIPWFNSTEVFDWAQHACMLRRKSCNEGGV